MGFAFEELGLLLHDGLNQRSWCVGQIAISHCRMAHHAGFLCAVALFRDQRIGAPVLSPSYDFVSLDRRVVETYSFEFRFNASRRHSHGFGSNDQGGWTAIDLVGDEGRGLAGRLYKARPL